jgi:hypothetical protein
MAVTSAEEREQYCEVPAPMEPGDPVREKQRDSDQRAAVLIR